VSFKLPVFSPDIEKCIKKDAFYTLPREINSLERPAWLFEAIVGEKAFQ